MTQMMAGDDSGLLGGLLDGLPVLGDPVKVLTLILGQLPVVGGLVKGLLGDPLAGIERLGAFLTTVRQLQDLGRLIDMLKTLDVLHALDLLKALAHGSTRSAS